MFSQVDLPSFFFAEVLRRYKASNGNATAVRRGAVSLQVSVDGQS